MAVTQKVTLYNNKFTVPPVINAVQNDTDRQVEVYFGDFTLQVGMTGKLSFIRSDRTHYEVSATLNTGANTATAELDQALTTAGVTQAQLKITDSGNVGSTFTFMIKVHPDVAGISQQQDGWSAEEFDQRLTDAENAIDAVEEDVADLQEKEYDYAPVITDTASGSIASFPDGADGYPLKECVVNVDAVQDLHGYDSPWPAGGGKNRVSSVTYSDATTAYHGVAIASYDLVAGKRYVISFKTPNTGVEITRGTPSDMGFDSLSAYAFTCDGTRKSLYGTATATTSITNVPVVKRGGTSGTPSTGLLSELMIEQVADTVTTPSPYEPYSNICPISGWSSAKVTRTGKNLLPITNGSTEISGVTFTVNADGSVTVNGTNTSGSTVSFPLNASTGSLPEGNYVLTGAPSGGGTTSNIKWFMSLYYGNSYANNWNRFDFGDGQTYQIGSGQTNQIGCRIGIGAGKTVDNLTFYPMLRLASDTDPTYEPYHGNTYTIPLGDTRYGAVLDVTRGKLRVTHGITSYEFPLPTQVDNKNRWELGTTLSDADHSLYGKQWTIPTDASISNNLPYKREADASVGEYSYSLYGHASSVEWRLRIPNTCTASEAQTIARASVLCYPIEPIEVDLTATDITTLLGTNNIFASTGDVSVTYACDTRRFIEKKLAELA